MMIHYSDFHDIDNHNEILDYLGIEEENKQEYWKKVKNTIKMVLDKVYKYTDEYNHIIDYIRKDDFYNLKLDKENIILEEIIDDSDDFVIYIEKDYKSTF